MESIGNRLFELRKQKGITQENLAEQLNVSRQSVSNWELDKSLPDTDRLFELAGLYEVSLDYIAYGIEASASETLDETVSKADEELIEKAKDLETTNAKAKKNAEFVSKILSFAIVCTTVILIPALVIYIGILMHLSNGAEDMNSNLVAVNQILDQYTYAEVTRIDDKGNYRRDVVWLDTKGLAEGDYVFVYTNPGESGKMKFEYYTKTMMIPFVLCVCLIFSDVVLFISIIKLKQKKS